MGHSAIMSVRITGNASDAIKAFEKTAKRAAAFGSFMGNVAARGVEKLWNKLGSFSSDVINMSDSVDKFKSTMRFAGIDSSAIDKAAKDARRYADETVYGLDDIQNTMAQLAANGVKNYTQVTQAAGNLNAVAGGNADTFKSVTMALTQTIGAGKLTTENWNQIADAIPGASGKLQEAMRKNQAFTGDFRDAMAKGQISAEEFSQALVDLGMTDVAREAATSTQTIEGALGNLEAAITGGLADAFDLIKPMVTGAMGAAAEMISTYAGRATKYMADFGKAFTAGGVLETGKTMLTDIGRALGSLGGAFGDVLGALNPFNTDLSNASTAGSIAAEMFNTLSEYAGAASNRLQDVAAWLSRAAQGLRDSGAANAFLGVWNRIAPTLQAVVAAIHNVVAGFLPAGSAMDTAANAGTTVGTVFKTAAGIVSSMLDALNGLAQWASANAAMIRAAIVGIGVAFAAFKIAPVVQGAIGAMQNFIGALKAAKAAQQAATTAQTLFNMALNANPIGMIVTAIGLVVAALYAFFTQTETGRAAWQGFTDWLGAAWQNLVTVLQPVIDALGQLWNSAVQFAGALWEAFSARLAEIWNAIQPVLQPVIDWITLQWQICGDAIKLVWDTVGSAITTIVNVIKGVFDVATAVIRGDWQAAGNAVRNIWNAIGSFFSGLVGRIGSFFSGLVGRITGYFSNAANGVRNTWNGVVSWFAGLPSRIAGIFAGAGSWLWNAGASIINGLWDGLKSAWGNVTSWVSGLGDWIKSHKGPPSYDKVLLTENGRLIMQGFARGLRSGFAGDVTRAINQMNGRLGSMPLTLAYTANADTTPAQQITVNVRFDGLVTDPEGVARQINRLLDDYSRKRR